jgi:hypothetical protein
MLRIIQKSFAIFSAVACVVACGSAGNEPSDGASSSAEELAKAPEAPLAWKPSPFCSACEERPYRSFAYAWDDAPPGKPEAAQKELGCGPVYRYSNGSNQGIIQYTGSFCPDTREARAYIHAQKLTAWAHPYCDQCLTIPCGKLFVLWGFAIGPGCPSGCRSYPAPPGI